MELSYNRIAGQNQERLAALSDGIFGVGMTLLVLDVRLPLAGAVHGEADLGRALWAIAPQLAMYLMSFVTLGIFWVGQQTQLNCLERTDRHLSWIHLGFLFAVTLVPLSTRLLVDFPAYRLALVEYWLNLLLLGGALYGSWGYSVSHRLLRRDLPAEVPAAVCRRIIHAQALYAAGAALCLVSIGASIGFIVAVQLYYAIAPRLPQRGKRPIPAS